MVHSPRSGLRPAAGRLLAFAAGLALVLLALAPLPAAARPVDPVGSGSGPGADAGRSPDDAGRPADPAGGEAGSITDPEPDEDLYTRVARQFYGSRRRGYQPPSGPTRDQTSPFGLEAQLGFASRDMEEFLEGQRFEHDFDSTRLLLKLTLRPAPFLELYGLGGGVETESEVDDADAFDGDLGLAWGGGARLTFFRNREWYDTTVFAEGRYLQFESEGTGEFADPADPTGPPISVDEEIRWREWEGRVGVSWRYYLARPYLGVRYSDAKADDIIDPGGPNDTRVSMDATDNIGGFLGFDLYFDPSRRVGLTAEVTFPDQVSGHVGLRVWF